MRGDVVVSFHEILHQHFPVPLAFEFERVNDLHVGEAEFLEILAERLDRRGEGRCVGVEIGEDKALPDFRAELGQPAIGFSKLLSAIHQGRPDKLARRVIAPSVVGAGE